MRLAILGDGLLAHSIFDASRGPDNTATMLGHRDFDITNLDSIVRAFSDWFGGMPDVIVNTVAFHKLLACESDRMLAHLVNTEGAGRVAGLAPTIYVSTDYVFNDGGPHDESMPGERPRSVYGQTKLGGELATLEHGGIVVRVSGLYHHRHKSHKGPSFPDLVTSSFDPMKLPTDQRFSPTYAVDAARRIVALAQEMADPPFLPDKPNGIYHAANAGSTSWYEFGQSIVEMAPHKRTLTGVKVNDPLRPRNSSLRSTRLPPLRHWVVALQEWATMRDRYLYENRVSPLRADPS